MKNEKSNKNNFDYFNYDMELIYKRPQQKGIENDNSSQEIKLNSYVKEIKTENSESDDDESENSQKVINNSSESDDSEFSSENIKLEQKDIINTNDINRIKEVVTNSQFQNSSNQKKSPTKKIKSENNKNSNNNNFPNTFSIKEEEIEEDKAKNSIEFAEEENNIKENDNELNDDEDDDNKSNSNPGKKLKQICINVFLHYSTFSMDDKDFILTQSNLIKLLKDLKIVAPNNMSSYASTKNIYGNKYNINRNNNFLGLKPDNSKNRIRASSPQEKTKELKMCEIDLLVKKLKKSNKIMDYNQFLNLVVLLSDKLYHNLFLNNQFHALELIVEKYFLPFYYNLSKEDSKIKGNSIYFYHQEISRQIKRTSFDSKTVSIFNDIYNSIKTLFSFYFKMELNKNIVNSEQRIKNSLEQFIIFNKEFELIPYFIELNKIVVIYHLIIESSPFEITKLSSFDGNVYDEKRNIGVDFTLSKFAMALFHISLILFDKLNYSMDAKQFCDVSNSEKLIILFDKLNQSKGISKVQKKFDFLVNKKISFLPSKRVISSINKIILSDTNINSNVGTRDTTNILNNENSNTRKSSNLNIFTDKGEINANKGIISNHFTNNEINSSNIDFADSKNNNGNLININPSFAIFQNKEKLNNENYAFMKSLKINTPEMLKRYNENFYELKSLFDEYSTTGEKFINHQMNITGYKKCLYELNVIKIKCSSHRNNVKTEQTVQVTSSRSKPNINLQSIPSNSIRQKYGTLTTRNLYTNYNSSKSATKNLTLKKNFITENTLPAKSMSSEFGEKDAELIFNKIKNKNSKFINFSEFMLGFEVLSQKIINNYYYSPSDKAKKFFDSYLLPVLTKRKKEDKLENIIQILGYLKESKIYLILIDIHKILHSLFLNYADDHEFICFNKLLQLLKDLTIFPDIVNLIQIKSMFYPLAELFKSQLIQEINNSNEFSNMPNKYNMTKINKFLNDNLINFENFCDILGICSFYVKDSQINQTNETVKFFQLLKKVARSNLREENKKNVNYGCLSQLNRVLEEIENKYILDNMYNNQNDNNMLQRNATYQNVINSPTSFDEICSLYPSF